MQLSARAFAYHSRSWFEPQHLPKTTTFLFKFVHVLEIEREREGARGYEREMCVGGLLWSVCDHERVVSFSCEHWGSNSDHQAWRQVPLRTDLSR